MSFVRALKQCVSVVAAAGVVAVVAGCGPSEVLDEGAVAAVGEGSTQYPLVLENCGRELTIDQVPQRVVSLDQNSTEILLSLGLEDRMVGTASWTDPVLASLEEENEQVPRLADEAPSYEALLDTDPDFVTASFGRHFKEEGGVVTRDRLGETGIGSYLSPTDCEGGMSINGGGTRTQPLTLDVLYQEIRDLSAIFDVQSRGEALIQDLEQRREAALDGMDLEGGTVAFWFADVRTPYVAGGLGAASLLAELTGMENVYDDLPDDWPAVGWESVVEKDPQIIVLGDLQRDRAVGDRLEEKADFLATDPLTSTMPAVQEKCFISLHGAEMNPSIRYVDGLEKIRDWADENSGCGVGGH